MIEWFLTVIVFLLVIAGMSIGVLKGRKTISGSCGGLNQIPGVESDCGGVCRSPCKKRKGHHASTGG
jgi:hypothetical protein